MAILVLINIPLVRFINTDWYHTLVDTIPGQMVIAVCIAAVFVSFALCGEADAAHRVSEVRKWAHFLVSVRRRTGRRTVFCPSNT